MGQGAMLLAIEGIDGAGKGTLARNLAARAADAGLKVADLSFPRYQETRFGTLIGQYLNGRFGPLGEVPVRFAVLLYAGDRFETRDRLAELRARSDLVILDRYVASNIAYNAAKLPQPERQALADWILELEYQVFGMPKADLTCLLATRPEVADNLVARKGRRGYTGRAKDLHEADRPYMAEVAAAYETLCADGVASAWFRCDPLGQDGALLPPERIAETVWARVRAALDGAGGET